MAADGKSKQEELLKEIRRHEVAIAEIQSLPASRAVYLKNCNIYFLKDVKTVVAAERKQLEAAKAQLQKLNAASPQAP